uniref:Uncharacterized protein n=1 Tax=Macrostomum lignano TaxID=282301 RepID=A0A1I8FK82_9PLAT
RFFAAKKRGARRETPAENPSTDRNSAICFNNNSSQRCTATTPRIPKSLIQSRQCWYTSRSRTPPRYGRLRPLPLLLPGGSRAQRRRRHRGNAEDNGARAGCLTEILWDDVQRAKDLLRLSRRRKQEPLPPCGVSSASTVVRPRWTPGLVASRLRRLRRVPLPIPRPAMRLSKPKVDVGLGELRRMLRDLVLNDRRTDKSLQSPACNASSVGDGIEESFEQFPLPVRQSPDCCDEAGDWGFESAELRQLEDEAAVQAALVAANRRLLSECPPARLAAG